MGFLIATCLPISLASAYQEGENKDTQRLRLQLKKLRLTMRTVLRSYGSGRLNTLDHIRNSCAGFGWLCSLHFGSQAGWPLKK